MLWLLYKLGRKTLLSFSEKVQSFSVYVGHKIEILWRQGREDVSIKLHRNYVKDKYIAQEWEGEVSLMGITKYLPYLLKVFL